MRTLIGLNINSNLSLHHEIKFVPVLNLGIK